MQDIALSCKESSAVFIGRALIHHVKSTRWSGGSLRHRTLDIRDLLFLLFFHIDPEADALVEGYQTAILIDIGSFGLTRDSEKLHRLDTLVQTRMAVGLREQRQ